MEKECACPEAAAAINSGVSATTCPTEEMIHLSRPSAPGPRDQDEDHVVQFHVNPGVTVSLQVGDSVRVVKGACVCICPFSRCCFQLLLLCLRVRSYLRSIRPLSHPAGAARRRAFVPPAQLAPGALARYFSGFLPRPISCLATYIMLVMGLSNCVRSAHRKLFVGRPTRSAFLR